MAVRTISLHIHASHTCFSARTQPSLFARSIPTELLLTTHTVMRTVNSQPRCNVIFCLILKLVPHVLTYTELIWPRCHEFMTAGVVLSSSHYQSGERVKLMSHAGREDRMRRRKTGGERKRKKISREEEGLFQEQFQQLSTSESSRGGEIAESS